MKALVVLLLVAGCSSGARGAGVCGAKSFQIPEGGTAHATVTVRGAYLDPVAFDGHLYVGTVHGVPAGEHAATARGKYPNVTLLIGTVVVPLQTSGCD